MIFPLMKGGKGFDSNTPGDLIFPDMTVEENLFWEGT